MPEKVVENLKSLNDIILTEQYMDFITNSRYTNTSRPVIRVLKGGRAVMVLY